MPEDFTHLKWTGDLPTERFGELIEQALTVLAEAPYGVEIDLRDASYLPSTLIGALTAVSIEAREQNKTLRVIVPGPVARVMRSIGVDRFVDIVLPAE